jgi:hypothetical protein
MPLSLIETMVIGALVWSSIDHVSIGRSTIQRYGSDECVQESS